MWALTEHAQDRTGVAESPHHARLWRWLAFDPPMRDPLARGCRDRMVQCRSCACDLGTVDDPFEGVFVAWRHRRQLRRRLA